ncbi:hypothetical protein DBR42_28790 [Pelomonas sp. HMWF004]|nr:hypothetical protein DBR42_28790 [Pelomonas sp. HMWF004]
MPADFKAKLAAQPEHYCHPGAELTQHLSRIAGMTRGGRKTLHTAATKIIAGVGTVHMIKKGRLRCHQGLVVPPTPIASTTW